MEMDVLAPIAGDSDRQPRWNLTFRRRVGRSMSHAHGLNTTGLDRRDESTHRRASQTRHLTFESVGI